jgi:hypothetical protein
VWRGRPHPLPFGECRDLSGTIFPPTNFPAYSHVIWCLRTSTSVEQLGTRVPFLDSPLSSTLAIEQFWGRAARASWMRKNPGRPFNFPPTVQFVEIVKFTVMRARVSTGCPFWR